MSDILAIAKSQKGTTEHGGVSKYGQWLDEQEPVTYVYAADEWCGAFQLWCIAQLGPAYSQAAGGIDKSFAYVQDWYDWMKTHGRISSSPKAGRLVWYDWAGTPSGANHIGMVDHFSNTYIWAWEGNHDNRVELVKRLRDHQIMGYGEWLDYVQAADDSCWVA
jgi:hypothetical protein